LQWRIDDRKALLVLLEGDVGDAERFAHLVVRHFHREIDGTVAGAILIATLANECNQSLQRPDEGRCIKNSRVE
jgi:hypothetical protein